MSGIESEVQTYPHKTRIQRFYTDLVILVTGSTGFLGKLLLDKLLRSCPDVKQIILLLREKKGKNPHQRLEALFKDKVYDRLRRENPNFLEHISVIEGDCTLPDLGLSAKSKAFIKSQVNVVFHCAATVRFDAELHEATAINIRATKDLISICDDCKKLKVFVHVSTAYSNCTRSEIDEVIYEPPQELDAFLKMIDTTHERTLAKRTPQILGKFPNTYTYTKNLTESMLTRESHPFPIIVFRPSVVTSTWKEPDPGWAANLNGVVGYSAGIVAGVIRVTQFDADCICDMVPADMVINGMIAAAWNKVENERNENIEVINYVSGTENPIKNSEFMYWGLNFVLLYPTRTPWYNFLFGTKYSCLYKVLFLFFNILPALILDGILYLKSGKTGMFQLAKRIYATQEMTKYFVLHEWKFDNRNIYKVWNNLDPEDRKLFRLNIKNMSWDEYLMTYTKAIRVNMLKDPLDTLPAARKRLNRLAILHYTVKYAFIGLALYYFYKIILSYVL